MTNTLEDLKSLSAARRWAKNGTARKVREMSELTQAEIAEVCNVDQSTIALWEKGERTPTGEPAKTYAQILIALGVNLPGGILDVERGMADAARTEGFGISFIEAEAGRTP